MISIEKFQKIVVIIVLFLCQIELQGQILNIGISTRFCLNQTNHTTTVTAIPSPFAPNFASYTWTAGHPFCTQSTVVPTASNGSTAVIYFPIDWYCCGNWYISCSGYDTNNNLISSVTVIDTLYCSPILSLTSSPSSNSLLCSGTQVTLTAAGSQTYSWSGPGIIGTSSSSISISPNSSGCYSVSSTNLNGCSGSASNCFTVINCLATNEQMSDITSISLYPNPIQDFLYLEQSGELKGGFSSIQIFNSLGICTKEVEIQGENKLIKIGTDGLPNGLYFLPLEGATRTILSKRFVINH